MLALSLMLALSASAAPVDSAIVAENNALGFRLLMHLTVTDPDANVLVSPASIAAALQMTCSGAAGMTRLEMAAALGLTGVELDRVNAANLALLQSLDKPGPGVELSIANSLWARRGVKLAKGFTGACQQYYRARVTSLDFASPKAATTINDWVKSSTGGRVPGIIEELSAADALVLLNAVWFKGQWQEKFDPALTRERPFYAWGETLPVPMMSRSGEFEYLEQPGDFQAVRLPYGEGRFSLYVFLPADEDDALLFAHALDPEVWQEWLASFTRSKGELTLPKFKVEYSTSLVDVLAGFGMESAFDPALADFSAMVAGPEELFISDVLHKGFVEVNEEGTEAAASTAVIMTETAPPPQPPFTMVCDRSFVYAVADDTTGAVLFLGAIQAP
jgi:serpin B